MGKEASRVHVHGICAAPFGNMEGTYKSMLPKSFFGIFPYSEKGKVSSAPKTEDSGGKKKEKEKESNEQTHVFDRFWGINLRLRERIHALHHLFITAGVTFCFSPFEREFHLSLSTDGHRTLLDHFHGLTALTYYPSLSHPILRSLQGDHRRTGIYRLPSELAKLRGRINNLVASKMTSQGVPKKTRLDKDTPEKTVWTHKG